MCAVVPPKTLDEFWLQQEYQAPKMPILDSKESLSSRLGIVQVQKNNQTLLTFLMGQFFGFVVLISILCT